MAGKDVHVGLVGAGIGGLAAAIALRRAGAKVTVLEAAPVLGEVCGFPFYHPHRTNSTTDWCGNTNGTTSPIDGEPRNLKLKYLGRLQMSAVYSEPGVSRT